MLQTIPQTHYPVEIAPRVSRSFFINDIKGFHEEQSKRVEMGGFLNRFLFRFVRAFVVTDDGMRFRAKIGKDVQKELAQIRLHPVKKE
jgi:hypothetical protein